MIEIDAVSTVSDVQCRNVINLLHLYPRHLFLEVRPDVGGRFLAGENLGHHLDHDLTTTCGGKLFTL